MSAIRPERAAFALPSYLPRPIKTETRATPFGRYGYGVAVALCLLTGAVAGLNIPAPAPLYSFNVASGNDWHTVDYDLTRDDCLALLAALPADAPSANCDPSN